MASESADEREDPRPAGQDEELPPPLDPWAKEEAVWAAAGPQRISARKTRLYVCACCRLASRLLTDDHSRQAVATAEQFADGLISKKKMKLIHRGLLKAREGGWFLAFRATDRDLHFGAWRGWTAWPGGTDAVLGKG